VPIALRTSLAVAAHEAPVVLVMAWVAVAGHNPLVCAAATLVLAAIAIAYAPFSRRRVWARDHLVDLGAMGAVMVLPLWSAAPVAGVHQHGAADLGPGAAVLQFAIVLAWAAIRIALLRRPEHRAPVSLASAVVCALGLAWMLIV
jgi:hypothetical protein